MHVNFLDIVFSVVNILLMVAVPGLLICLTARVVKINKSIDVLAKEVAALKQ